jgi:hypothetical protein
MNKPKYFVTYILVARWEKGGTQKKREFFETEQDLKNRVSALAQNIRVGAIKMYELENL